MPRFLKVEALITPLLTPKFRFIVDVLQTVFELNLQSKKPKVSLFKWMCDMGESENKHEIWN